jgi:AmmeMemoRadiSam system protein B
MMRIRRPAVAGRFYPSDPAELEQLVQAQLREVDRFADEPVPKALVAPHAGYIYSGPVAASACARLAPAAQRIQRVVLLGPSHHVPFEGLATSTAEAFATPLGLVPIDRDALEALGDLPQVHELDAAHAQEHSLEVHLPFLQVVLGEFSVVPLVVGVATSEEVAEVIDRLWGGDETVIVVSSDLSHYYDYAKAQRLDAATTRAIEMLGADAIGEEDACGRYPLCGLLLAAGRRGLSSRAVDVRNSGDTAGPRDQVVGYGSYVLA